MSDVAGEGEQLQGRWHRWFVAIAESLGTLRFWQLTALIWLSSIGMSFFLLGMPNDTVHGTMNIVENWGAIERVALWQKWLDPVIPRFELPVGVIAWGFRASMLAGFVAQIGAFIVAMKQEKPNLWLWLLGPIGAHLIQ